MTPKYIQIPGSNYKAGRKVGEITYKPEAIVIHLADGSFAGTIAWFQNPQSNVSAHYLIDRDGSVVRFVDEANTAFHAGALHQPTWAGLKPNINPNAYTIGIEHAGRPGDAWTDAMYCAGAQLIHDICERWGIQATDQTIIRHSTINALHAQCPGDQCDLERLIRESRMDPE